MNTPRVPGGGARRRTLGIAVAGVAAGALGVTGAALAGTGPPPEDGEKVTICHRVGGPHYNVITLDANGAVNGHSRHASDVIPPIPSEDYAGKNWPEGEALLKNGCFPLIIDKTAPEEVVSGGTIPYSVKVTNIGLKDVPFGDISVKDWIKKVGKLSLKGPSDITDLEPGESRTWTGSYVVKDDPESPERCGQVIKNTAKVTLERSEPGPPNGQRPASRQKKRAQQSEEGTPPKKSRYDSVKTTVICPLDVSISKASAEGSVAPGGTVNYTLGVKNTGPLPIPTATIVVTDETASAPPVPPADLPKYLEPKQTANWTASKSVALDAALCGTSVQNTATVALDFTGGEWPKYSFTPGADDTATAAGVLVTGGICPTVTAAGTPVVGLRPASPALEVSKTGTARVLAGGNVVYRITVTNTGGADATGVVLNETPPGTLVWRAVPAGATRSGRNVSWNIGTLTAGQSVTKTVSFKMRRTATGRSCNVASATSTNAGSARDRACTTVSVARRPATPVTG